MMTFLISSTILIALVLVLRQVFRGKVSATFIYAMWTVVLVRLLVPVQVLPMPARLEESLVLHQEVEEQEDMDPNVVEGYDPQTEGTYLHNTWTDQVVGQVEPIEESSEEADFGDSHASFASESGIPAEESKAKSTVSVATVLKWVWVSVASLMFVVVLLSNIHLNRILRKSRKIILDVNKPYVYETDCVLVPCLYGLFRPTIYLTKDAAKREEERKYIILHEQMHYRHFDYLWSVFRAVLVCVYWFHPMVWVAAKVSRQDAEYAADEAVVKIMSDEERVFYGKIILNTFREGRVQKRFLAASLAYSTKKELKKRMLQIAKRNKKSLVTVALMVAMVLGVTACAFAGKKETKNKSGKTREQ